MIDLFIEVSLGTILPFLIFICYLKKLVAVYLLCKKRAKITCHKEKSQPPPPAGYQMVRPLQV